MDNLNLRLVAAWAIGGATGFSIWAASLPVFGVQEPWDGSLLRYFLIVFLSGAVCEVVASPRRRIDLLCWPAAFVIGELVYMATQPDRWSLWPLALIATVLGAIPSVIGVAVVRKFMERSSEE